MNLLIWRHADAAPGEPDHQRPLTPLGNQQAQFISTWIKTNVPGPYRVFGSPALRASQTAAALGAGYEAIEALGYKKETATGAAVLRYANWPNATETVIFVGHQPTVGRVNALLHTGSEQDSNMQGGSLWWFSSEGDGDKKLGFLKAVISP
jgi:phosphohistidine phosphatase